MRVIAGRLRGRRLLAPPGANTRPITDRVKETLFSILGTRFGTPGAIPETDVLDLFAGTGSLGIEALSRGARSCLFVERDWRTISALRQNISSLSLQPGSQILRANAWTVRLAPTPAYGLIFADPPYRDAADPLRLAAFLEGLASHLTENGLIVLRRPAASELPSELLRLLVCVDDRRIGTMRLCLFARVGPEGPSPHA